MTKVRAGLVGCGKVGQLHARALTSLDEAEFVGVCDTTRQRATEFAERYGVTAFESVDAMVRRGGVQAVMVCTPHPLHESPTVEAARAGAHVLVEKPLASTLSACDTMLRAADESNVKLGIVSQRRFLEPVQRMKAAIDDGKIGQPILGHFVMYSWRDESYYASDPWRGTWDGEGGGVLVNQSPHQLDLLQWLMGEITEISGYWANLNHPTIEVEDTAVANLRFRSGAIANLITSVSQKPGIYTKVHIHGSNGASVGVQTDTGASFVAGMSEIVEPPLNDLWTIPGEEDMLAEFRESDRKRFAGRDATQYYHTLQIQDFLRAILEDRSPLVSGREGRTVVEMFTAIYRSNEQRRPIEFPLESCDSK
ncbi:MAG: Gfo/Idh/MocA family oxidoreductase [Planctomycetota bacterium]